MIGLLAALAGGLGAVVRFLVDRFLAARVKVGLPLGTVVINVTGSFCLGLLVGWWQGADPVRTVFGTGLLGGYTTFSTASVEGVRLFLGGRGWRALLHSGGMLLAGVLAAALGLLLTS